jgi:DNA-directed RNA polymerase sigma subunit (sigma70/sigma32)
MRGSAYHLWCKQQAQRRAQIKSLHAQGKTLRVLAQLFGVSYQRIHQIVTNGR